MPGGGEGLAPRSQGRGPSRTHTEFLAPLLRSYSSARADGSPWPPRATVAGHEQRPRTAAERTPRRVREQRAYNLAVAAASPAWARSSVASWRRSASAWGGRSCSRASRPSASCSSSAWCPDGDLARRERLTAAGIRRRGGNRRAPAGRGRDDRRHRMVRNALAADGRRCPHRGAGGRLRRILRRVARRRRHAQRVALRPAGRGRHRSGVGRADTAHDSAGARA